jgi:glycosyltransferase involved in cell wall biosynthesis
MSESRAINVAEMPLGDAGRTRAVDVVRAERPRIAFVTNFCPHYRVKTFELLAERVDVDFYFYSDGAEWYWQKQHGTQRGQFTHEYLRGFRLLGTRITPTLPGRLRHENYQAIVKCTDGRFALAASYLTARLSKRPFILWTGIWCDIDTPFHRMAAPLMRRIYRGAAAIVTYGEHVKRYLERLGVPGEKIFVTTHAVDNEAYARAVPAQEVAALREKLRVPAESRVLLYLGRLEECKGLPYLLEAFQSVKNKAVLVIAGDGSERPALERLSTAYGVRDNVRFIGYVEASAAVLYYAMAYAFVLPSVTTRAGRETWGLVVNEAMNQGVPVIATETVGAAAGGLVRDRENGFVVPERDAGALARAMDELLESPKLREEMGENAQRIISTWNNEQMVAGFEQAVAYALRKSDPVLTSW